MAAKAQQKRTRRLQAQINAQTAGTSAQNTPRTPREMTDRAASEERAKAKKKTEYDTKPEG